MWIQITSGQGPDECELAVTKFFEYLQNLVQSAGSKIDVLEISEGVKKGNLQSVLFSVPAEYSEIIKPFKGSILWKCISPYRPHHKRKNWFIETSVLEEPSISTFNENDVKYETMRSSGPGGQHVNKTESGVRATHIPSGISTTAMEERSQHNNKKLALARLADKIAEANSNVLGEAKQSRWTKHLQIERGNPVATFSGPNFKLE
ncbi:peptide chain release factor H [Myxococcota bacterium]|nr:peptide chain release factor H [Myxococcota bacterium]MBU1379928.1 peptide chain release factor H [Myxococcota bacterium]MBU1497387.1 peptide chain release factor H [Myxococcota bacterium]